MLKVIFENKKKKLTTVVWKISDSKFLVSQENIHNYTKTIMSNFITTLIV